MENGEVMEKQKKFCKDKGYPLFVSESGICLNCKGKIPDTNKELITGCPFCNHSFCG